MDDNFQVQCVRFYPIGNKTINHSKIIKSKSPELMLNLKNKLINLFNVLSQLKPKNIYYYFLKPVKNQKLFIHIGMPKTGSSAIQAFLALNKIELKKHGFSFPNHTGFKQAFQTSAGNAADMATWIKNGNTEVFKRFMVKARTKNVLLSSEILYSALRDFPDKFAQFFSKYEVRIICYIREMGDLAESYTNQLIKNHFLVDYSEIKNTLEKFNYYQCLIKSVEYFEKSKLIVKKYDKNSFYKGNIYADFMKILNIEIDENFTLPERFVNPSLNRDALEFRILLNKSFFAKNNQEYKYKINGLLAAYSVKNANSVAFPLLSKQKRSELTHKYKKYDGQINALFFNEGSRLFSNSNKEFQAYKGLSHAKIEDILLFIKSQDDEFYPQLVKFIEQDMDDEDKSRLLPAIKKTYSS